MEQKHSAELFLERMTVIYGSEVHLVLALCVERPESNCQNNTAQHTHLLPPGACVRRDLDEHVGLRDVERIVSHLCLWYLLQYYY